MAILRKKLDVKPGLPDHIKNNLTIWRSLHLAICAAFSELTEMSWEAGKVEINFGELKALQSALPDTGLCFSYGDAEGPGTLLAYYEPRFAAQVTARSLEIQADVVDETYVPGMLDLILFKPVIQSFDTELGDIFAATYNIPDDRLRQLEQAHNLEDIGLAKDVGVWNEVTFYIQQAEDINSKSGADKAKSKTKKKADPKTVSKPSSLAFRILLPQSLLQHLLASSVNEAASPVIDAQNPWTHHMRQSLDTAIVPVRAVVETCRMTVADCTRFEIGQIIDLPGVSLQSIGLETEMIDGNVNFGSAALGIYKAHRAVKLIENVNPEFCPESLII